IEFAEILDAGPMCELVTENWKQVGIYATARQIGAAEFSQRLAGNELKATATYILAEVWSAAGARDYLPQSLWGPLWTQWHDSRGEAGEEPPAAVKELYDAHAEFMASVVGSPESKAAFERIAASHRDNVWTFNPVEHIYIPSFWSAR